MKQPGLLLLAMLSMSAYAMDTGDARTPTPQQLVQLLSGNTMNGKWDGRPFTQHFAAGGSTRYREGSGAISVGSWSVNQKGQYCSVWPSSPSEACYDLLVKENHVLWKSGGKIHPSEVVTGDTF